MNRSGVVPKLFVLSLGLAGGSFADEVVRVPDLPVTGSNLGAAFEISAVDPLATPAEDLDWSKVFENRPGVHFNASGAGTYGAPTSVRGLSNSPYFGQAALTTYIGDIPLFGPAATPSLLPGLQQVSWVSAQNSPFSLGRASSGGTALLEFNPAPKAGYLTVGSGSRSLLAAEAGQSWTSGSLSARAAFGLYQRDGYVSNIEGITLGDRDHRGANAEISWRASSSLSFKLLWVGSQARDGEQPLVPMASQGLVVERTKLGRADSDFNAAALRADALTPFGALTSISSFSRWDLRPYENALVLPPRLDTHMTQRQKAASQEFRLKSGADAAYPWSAGAFLSTHRTEGDVDRSVFGMIPIEASSYVSKRSAAAVFGEAVLFHDNGWSLVGKGRAERERQTYLRNETVPAQNLAERGVNRTRWTPALTAAYAMDRQSSLSLTWSETYKPGGFSAYTDRADLAGFSAERNRAWDLEYTSSKQLPWPFALRLYRYDIRNYQVERSFTQTDYLVVNAPKALSEGIEFENTFRLLEGWDLRATAGWTRTELRSFTDPFSGVTFDGTALPFAPKMKARLDTGYKLGHGLTARAGLTVIGRTYFTEAEDPAYSQSRYEVADFALVYERGPLSVSARLDNAFDRYYRTQVIPGIDHAMPGEPRTWSFEATYRW